MKYFIQAQDFELWDIIEEGYIEAPKKKKKQRSENDTKAKLNSRAMHILLCGLNEEVSKKVSTCKRAKEMWEKLERIYGKEEKKDDAPSCANLLSSSKVDGVLALNESKHATERVVTRPRRPRVSRGLDLSGMLSESSLTLWRQEGKEDQGITFVQVRFYGYGRSCWMVFGESCASCSLVFCIFGLEYRYSSVVSVPEFNTGIHVSVLLDEYRYPFEIM
ncbi:hypothetical protein GQ457_04G015300 [Hibiscus cannabinus]